MLNWFKKEKQKSFQNTVTEDIIEKCSVYYIPCDKIRPNALRSRCDFNEDKLITLAYSIKKYGIIEPLCVRITDDDDTYDYELVFGERRLRAARLANIASVPCIIVDIEPLYSAELSIIENTQSESLNCFETAAVLKRLSDYSDYSLEELASRLSISQTDLFNKICLLELSYAERQILLNLNFSENVSVAIAKILDRDLRSKIFEYILSNDVTEASLIEYINSQKIMPQKDVSKIPREISSVIKSFSSKVNFLNKQRKRANIAIKHDFNEVKIEISIKY